MQDITLLRQSLPYIRRFKGSVFVVKFGGESLKDHATLTHLAGDIALLHNVGIRVLLVHGGGVQVTDMQAKLGIETRMVAGRRVTDEATIDVLKMVLAGKMNTEIVAALKHQGVRALGFSAMSGGVVEARRRPPVKVSGGGDEPVDFGQVGDIATVDTRPLRLLLEADIVPVISPLAADADGNVLNINADVVAARIAHEIGAAKLILMTSTPGVMEKLNDRTTLISTLSAEQARSAVRSGMIKGGMIPKVEESIKALEKGVERVHIISGLEPHQLLLEIFTESGCGTMLTP